MYFDYGVEDLLLYQIPSIFVHPKYFIYLLMVIILHVGFYGQF